MERVRILSGIPDSKWYIEQFCQSWPIFLRANESRSQFHPVQLIFFFFLPQNKSFLTDQKGKNSRLVTKSKHGHPNNILPHNFNMKIIFKNDHVEIISWLNHVYPKCDSQIVLDSLFQKSTISHNHRITIIKCRAMQRTQYLASTSS